MAYDWLIVGAGLAGATFARLMSDRGARCVVIDRRPHIAGNVYSEVIENIEVHKYGPHIFHTDKEAVWKFVNRFASFNHFIYSPIANYDGELYPLPFNMNTFYALWKIVSPLDAKHKIAEQARRITHPRNLEEQAISLVGRDVYEKLIKGYTEKQWGYPCDELPAEIIRRLPVRFTYDNNYFNHPHQGIPEAGYTAMVERMLDGIEVILEEDYLVQKGQWNSKTDRIFYTGPIDEFYGYCYGELEYRSLRFETEILEIENYQGVAGMNFTDNKTPYTRIIEHKHFKFGKGNPNTTVITREYPVAWKPGDEPYYPVNNDKNRLLYDKYNNLAKADENIIFGGRLGKYQYFDMDYVIADTCAIAATL